MNDVLRFSGATRHDPAVDIWLAERSVDLRSIAQEWFALMRKCGADVLELIHDGCPVVCVQDVPFAYVNVFRSHVNVGFFNGAELGDPKGLLEGTGKRMRHVKLKPDRETNAEALGALVAAAYIDGKVRAEKQSAASRHRQASSGSLL